MDTTMFTSLMASGKKKHSDLPTNLRVAVRIRPMNKSERDEKCTNIVKVEKFNTSVQCKGKPFGPFFKVFDESATQEDVYKDVVSSQTKKVISGFNCTVFAYGQTGTGKTFTMEGGRGDAKSSKDDTSTGIIPRAVEDIFEQLEASNCEEYSLRVSYVELYNEELFDLLAPNSEAEDRERLRIYDDPSKKGVIVSGVEEVPVRCRSDVYKLLELGAEKRRTAATLMNQRSSRSHSLFMVNVVVRENSISGEELVKQGKLNLVDLAGSENIGRSGAQGNRAKEAGSINQSLLTLGRVIRSLTTNAQHIPYRESKLTRLLQDSLGGSTITSLIATMSPASSNFEESQSTLEYAMRAANIKNKPICNTKVSKKTILKEYSDEIEKLRRDLRAAREKNGVIISEESHEELQRNTERVHELEEQLNSVVDRLRRFTEDLMHMDEQYKHVFERKGELEERLRERLRNLAEAEKELEDKKDELQTYMAGLDKMYVAACQSFGQAKQMRDSADDMKQDLMAYWNKVDEMAASDETNQEIVAKFAQTMTEFSENIERLTTEDRERREEIRKIVDESKEAPIQISRKIKDQLIENSDFIKNLTSSFQQKANELDNSFASDLKKFTENIDRSAKSNIEKFNQLYSTFFDDAKKVNEVVCEKLGNIQEKIEEFRREIDPLITEMRGSITESSTRRQSEQNQIKTEVDSKCAALMEFCKNMMSSIESLSENTSSKINEFVIADQNSMESQLSTLATMGDVMMSIEDGVSEETSDVCELKTEAENRWISNKETFEANSSTFSETVSKSIDDVEAIKLTYTEDSVNARTNFVSNVEEVCQKSQNGTKDCDELTRIVDETTGKVSDMMKRSSSNFAETIGTLSSNAKTTITSVKYSRTNPKANVPARITAPVLTSHELYNPPQPENVLKSSEDFNDEDVQIVKQRRVSTFVRRDSLLDTTNIFSSPSSLLERRNCIQEEDGENY